MLEIVIMQGFFKNETLYRWDILIAIFEATVNLFSNGKKGKNSTLK